jgi:UDP-N-acetylmuramoylalanine--D-glutamate ligase
MRTIFYDKKVTVVGLARSGVGAANLLCSLGAKVTVTDMKGRLQLEEFIRALAPGISLALENHPQELFDSPDLIVISPGVPGDIAPLRIARGRGVRIIGELELAYEVLRSGLFSNVPGVLAVTGTNGKSTTTALLNEMLRHGGINTVLGGNIGNSIASELLDRLNTQDAVKKAGYIVLELSSFQLETIEFFRPLGAAILNVTPDHLDRYSGMESYIATKCRVSQNQGPSDYLILNADDAHTPEVENLIKARKNGPGIFYFSRQREVMGAFFSRGLIHFNIPTEALGSLGAGIAPPDSSFFLDPASFCIKGVHNIENAMAAALMAYLAGCDVKDIGQALGEFPGLEHRLEFVREADGVRYINDSKGTNIDAVLKSLEGFDAPVVLIAGGKDKDSDFNLMRPLLREKVKKVILVGAAAEKMRKAFDGYIDYDMAGYDFHNAVEKARKAAVPGDVVLLSPACASFDMFRDFEDRGRQFKQLVKEL